MKIRNFLLTLALLVGLFVAIVPDSQAQTGNDFTTDDLYVAMNQSIIEAENRPLGRSAVLDDIAQQIADEISATGAYTIAPRVLADDLGYPRWPDNGQRVLNVAINYIGIEDPEFFAAQTQEEVTEILSNTFYREMGVGVSTFQAVAEGTVQNVYVVMMGAQPNVLPVVINDGDDTVFSRDVSLYIHNELSLAYETDVDIIQQAPQIRVANSEAELDDAQPIDWQDNNFALPWRLTDEFGQKEVWVQFEDEKGVQVRSVATVNFEDPANAPAEEDDSDAETETTSSEESVATLNLTYSGETFTLAVDSELETVRLQEVYFQWDLQGFDRAYEIENPEDLQSVNLETFSTADCVQIRWAGAQSVVNVAGCENIFLEARRFSELQDVFWDVRVGTFEVWDGPRLLGECSVNAGSCTVTLR